MISQAKVRQIASEVAKANLDDANIQDVTSEPSSDSQGRDALRITIVVPPDAVPKLDGERLLNTLVQIHERLSREGEERLAIVEYATEEELEEGGDS
jgi:hypothetical protein